MKDKHNKKHKMKSKNKKRSDRPIVEDMDSILSDPRFSHVATDPKLRYIPKEKTKVKIDHRFSSLMTDNQFYENSTMDPRGRKGNYSTKEDLKKFYSMSSTDSSESGDSDDEDEEADSSKIKKTSKIKKKKKKINKVKHDLESEEEEDLESETREEKEPSLTQSGGEDDEEIPLEIQEQLQKYDFSRGVAEFTDSSDDDSTTTDTDEDGSEGGEGEEFEWGELDKDAVWDDEENNVEETNRFAVCNMNWDRVNSTDLMLLFSSPLPSGGSIKSVKIYLSQYGKERLEEENKSGPQEIVQLSTSEAEYKSELKDLERLEKGQLKRDNGSFSKKQQEAVRRYQRNRLKYYYAVVEFDSVASSSHVYKEYDRHAFEGSGTLLDLRYIPTDMTFDEEAVDVCEKLPKNYKMKNFTTSALQDSTPSITWDETADERRKDILSVMNQITKGEDPDYQRLEAYIASNSSEDEDEEVTARKKQQAKKLKQLLKEIDKEQDEKDKEKEMFKEINSDEDFPDFDKMEEDISSSENDTDEEESKKEEEEEIEDPEDTSPANDLELLVNEDDDKHFSIRKIMEEDNQDKKKKKKGRFSKKKSKREIEEEKEIKREKNKFKVEIDSRFSELYTSNDYHIDPTSNNFMKTDCMNNLMEEIRNKNKRTLDSLEEMPPPKRNCKDEKNLQINNVIHKLKSKNKHKKS